MVTQNKTWRFSKRIKMITINYLPPHIIVIIFIRLEMNGAKLNASIVVPRARGIKCTD